MWVIVSVACASLHVLALVHHPYLSRGCCRRGSSRSRRCRSSLNRSTRLRREGVIVIEAGGLRKVIRDAESFDEAACDEWADDEYDEEEEHEEVEDRVANDATFAQLCLLERVDGRTDLSAALMCKLPISKSARVRRNVPWTKPEEHDRVEFVDVGDEKHR